MFDLIVMLSVIFVLGGLCIAWQKYYVADCQTSAEDFVDKIVYDMKYTDLKLCGTTNDGNNDYDVAKAIDNIIVDSHSRIDIDEEN